MTRSEYHRYRGDSPAAPVVVQDIGEEVPVSVKLNATCTTVLKTVRKLRRVQDERGVGVPLAETTGLKPDIVNFAIGVLAGHNMVTTKRQMFGSAERIVDLRVNPESQWWDEPPDIAAKLLEALADGPIEDAEGKAGTVLVGMIESPWGQSHTRKIIKELAAAGKITRVINGKRTLRIALVEEGETVPTAARLAPKKAVAKPANATDDILALLYSKNAAVHQDELAKETGTPREEVREIMRTLLAKGSIEVLNRHDGLFVAIVDKFIYGGVASGHEISEEIDGLIGDLAAARAANSELQAKLDAAGGGEAELDLHEVADNLLEKVLGIISGADEEVQEARQSVANNEALITELRQSVTKLTDDLELANMEIDELQQKLAVVPAPGPADSFDLLQRKLVAKIATRSRKQ